MLQQNRRLEIDKDDPDSKKRKRQLRNRDAAVKSRERKKMYVKDLETKSKFMERECLRLGRLLQCFISENQALRFSLQKGSAFGVSSTKQESAVLLSESLLLGSLLWFLGIIMCLFNLLAFPKSIPEPAPLSNAENKGQGSLVPTKEARPRSNVAVTSFLKTRKCKASRTKDETRLSNPSFSSSSLRTRLVYLISGSSSEEERGHMKVGSSWFGLVCCAFL